MSNRPDFRAIKARVTMRDVLAKYGVELRQLNGNTGRGKCPLPTHDPEATEHTFSVDFGKNVWACHSSSCVAGRNVKKKGGGLKKGGDVLEFVQYMEKAASLRVAGERLESWFGPFGNEPVMTPIETESEPIENSPLAFELKGIEHGHPYLSGRGFDEEECEYMGVGFFPGKGSMQDRIVFPIHNEKGELVAYAGRHIVDGEPRWKLPAGFSKSRELYNLHRVEDSEVVVVESFWGVLACVRAGIMNAVAVMGTSISDRQAEMLAARFGRVILMLDGDEHGREAIGAAVHSLVMAEAHVVDIAFLPKGCQPDEISPDNLRRLLRLGEIPAAWSLVEESVPETA
jgi:Toprim-like/DNA primase catalytic core, N-terminal domain